MFDYIMLPNLSVIFKRINKSLIAPFSEGNWMEKGVSVRIFSRYARYMVPNSNAYILKHSLRVTTAGPERTVSEP